MFVMTRSQAIFNGSGYRECTFSLGNIAAAGIPNAGSVSALAGLSWGKPHTPMHRGNMVEISQ